ncbi:MAG: DNA alkylation repair protein [Janthinobacterium lividum]
MSEAIPAALKEIFNQARIVHIASQMRAVHGSFDQPRFIALASEALDGKGIMQRLRHLAVCLHATLEMDFQQALPLLRLLAPRIEHGFASMILPEYVALFGLDEFDTAMEALAFFTGFGSSEFAVRHFLQRDQARALAIMERWSKHDDAHVRRLASEGSRPRLPWSFQLKALMADPSGTAAILENLRADESLYVRKSVANHLNDISKDNAHLVLKRLASWDLNQRHSAWIARHALRTLIKKGNADALALVGVTGAAAVELEGFSVSPAVIELGQRIVIEAVLVSTSAQAQKLEVDYAVLYARKSGQARKVFKFKQMMLKPQERRVMAISQTIRDFSTRKHHPGHHRIELLVNGVCLATAGFDLLDFQPAA